MAISQGTPQGRGQPKMAVDTREKGAQVRSLPRKREGYRCARRQGDPSHLQPKSGDNFPDTRSDGVSSPARSQASAACFSATPSTSYTRAVEALDRLVSKIPDAKDDEELRGIEGAAAAAYFGVFREMLSPPWLFPGRVRRPPTDPVNALLSLGYTLLCSEMGRYLRRRGFDLRIGLFHGLRYGRQSLPLDMVEEFRAPLVDRFVLKLLNLKQLHAGHFETLEGGAVHLESTGRRLFYESWEKHLAERAVHLPGVSEHAEEPLEMRAERGAGFSDPGTAVVTWRHRLERQVARLRRHLMKGVPYRPLVGNQAPPTPPSSNPLLPGGSIPPPREEDEGG